MHIALALKPLIEKTFITVDIRDVNDPESQPWKAHESPASPLELIKQVEGQDYTQFVVSTSLEFFQKIIELRILNTLSNVKSDRNSSKCILVQKLVIFP